MWRTLWNTRHDSCKVLSYCKNANIGGNGKLPECSFVHRLIPEVLLYKEKHVSFFFFRQLFPYYNHKDRKPWFMPLHSLNDMHIFQQALASLACLVCFNNWCTWAHATMPLNFSQSGSIFHPVFRSHLLYLKQLCWISWNAKHSMNAFSMWL